MAKKYKNNKSVKSQNCKWRYCLCRFKGSVIIVVVVRIATGKRKFKVNGDAMVIMTHHILTKSMFEFSVQLTGLQFTKKFVFVQSYRVFPVPISPLILVRKYVLLLLF